MRLIYYSLARTPDGRYDRQWIQSIRSLRRHNCDIAVLLFAFNGVSDEVAREADLRHVAVVSLGSYREWMSQRPHARSSVLAIYPTLPNLLLLAAAEVRGVSQALYADCDTFFFRDPEILFEQCCQYDWYGREIPGSRLSPHGLTTNLDEALIADIAAHEGLRARTPFNTGVCILNRDTWIALCQLEEVFLDYSWRLLVGMHHNENMAIGAMPRSASALRSETTADLQKLRALASGAATDRDYERALPYPSDNWWILNEIAWLLAAGQLDRLTQGVFTTDQVGQGSEFSEALKRGAPPIVVHYFGHFEREFFQHVPAIPPG